MATGLQLRIKISVRRFTINDLGTIFKIENESFGPLAWSPDIFQEYAHSWPELFFVATVSRKIVGFSIACIEHREAEVDSIAVRPRFRGQGVATALLNATLRKVQRSGASNAWLMVRCRNRAAVSLYRKLGFVRTSSVSGYYGDGSTAWRMRLALTSPEKLALVMERFGTSGEGASGTFQPPARPVLHSEPMASNLEDKKRDWEQLRKESRLRNRFKEAAAQARIRLLKSQSQAKTGPTQPGITSAN